MTGPTLRRSVTTAALVAVWCGLWGEPSVANIAGGTVVGYAATSPRVSSSYRGGIRLGALARFVWLVAIDLVRSTISVAREVLTITDSTDEAIIAVDVPEASRNHLLLLVVAITLTPGTAVVETDSDTSTLYLHLLHHENADATVAHVQELAALACAALPTNEKGLRP